MTTVVSLSVSLLLFFKSTVAVSSFHILFFFCRILLSNIFPAIDQWHVPTVCVRMSVCVCVRASVCVQRTVSLAGSVHTDFLSLVLFLSLSFHSSCLPLESDVHQVHKG